MQKKLILDLTFGAAIPLAILSWGTPYIGARPTFALAGLIPAAYVIWDILFYSKRFNFITTVIAITAVTQGSMALLTVDGWKYALADTSGTILTFLLFGGSLLLGKPIVNYFVVQVFEPKDLTEESLLWRMLNSPGVHRVMVLATLIILLENLLRGVGNYVFNINVVTAAFGTEEFNLQKRNVDGWMRFLAPATSIGALFAAFYLVNKCVDDWLDPVAEEGGTMFDQIRRRLGDAPQPATAPTTPSAAAPVATPAAQPPTP